MIDLKENLKLKVVPAISVDTNNWIYDVLVYSNISSDNNGNHNHNNLHAGNNNIIYSRIGRNFGRISVNA